MKLVVCLIAAMTLVGCASRERTEVSLTSTAEDLTAGSAELVADQFEKQSTPMFFEHRLVVHEFEHERFEAPTPAGYVFVFPSLSLVTVGNVVGTYRSVAVESDQPFRELVPSWNVETDAPLLIDARVREAESGEWTRWLRLGRAGPVGTDEPEPLRSWEGGKVAVDLIDAKVDLDAWQYRLTLAGEGKAIVRRIAMVETRSAAEGTATPRPRAGRVEIELPFRSQMTQRPEIAGRICSPTSVTMVLAGHATQGHESPAVQTVADMALDPDFDIYGNWPRNVQTAFELGVEGYVSRVNSWEQVEQHLLAGRPLIASIRVRAGELEAAPYPDTSGHLIVVRGFDGRGGVHVSDPAVKTPELGELVYPMVDLENVWFHGSAGTTYVLLPGES